MAKSDFQFFHPLRVRWAEVDRQGVVFNGHYFTYFDVAMTEYFRNLGYPYPDELLEMGSDLFVVKASADYHASAEYDDELEIGTRVGRVGNSSLQLLFGVFCADDLLVSGELIYVNANPKSRRSKSLPDPLRNAIENYEPALR